ncbi:MAG: hypothetical protein KAG98_02800 [Lentisphaeria bacterium]|nr:hypothetical protein [Lentisphaeria bacterium]
MYTLFSKLTILIMLMTTILGNQLFCIDSDGCVDAFEQHHQSESKCCAHTDSAGDSISHTDHHTCNKVIQNLYANAFFSVSQFFAPTLSICNPIYTMGFIRVVPKQHFSNSFKVEIPPPILRQLSTVVILT